jgi:predicted ATPase
MLNPLLNGLAGVLGLTLRSADNAEEEILDHLRDRRLLLILDNLEHLLESSTVISTLLRGADGITVLATSRERLNLQEEWLFPLAGLDVPSEEQWSRADEGVRPPAGCAICRRRPSPKRSKVASTF